MRFCFKNSILRQLILNYNMLSYSLYKLKFLPHAGVNDAYAINKLNQENY